LKTTASNFIRKKKKNLKSDLDKFKILDVGLLWSPHLWNSKSSNKLI